MDALAELIAREKDPELIEMMALEKDPERWDAYVVARSIKRGDSKLADVLTRDAPRTERFYREVVAALDRKPGLLRTTKKLRIVAAWGAAWLRAAQTPTGYDPSAKPTYRQVEDQYVRLRSVRKETSGLTSEEKQTILQLESRGFDRAFIEDSIGKNYKRDDNGELVAVSNCEVSSKESRDPCLPAEQYMRDTLKEFGLELRSSPPGRPKKETKKIPS